MRRYLFLLTCLLFIVGNLHSQFQYYVPKEPDKEPVVVYPGHDKGEKRFSLFPAVVTGSGIGAKMAGGLSFQIFLGERVSLDTELSIGKDYIQAGPGVIAIPFWVLFFSESDMFADNNLGLEEYLFMMAAGVLSLEHFSFHIPLKKDLEISPYISLLSFRGNPQSIDMKDGSHATFATGIHLNKSYGRLFVSPFAEYSVGYTSHISRFSAGVGFGVSFLP